MNDQSNTTTLQPSWLSVRGGHWHIATRDTPSWATDEKTLCGLTTQPVNVTWHEPPPTIARYVCKHCLRKHGKPIAGLPSEAAQPAA